MVEGPKFLMAGSMPLGTLFGIPVRLHLLFFFVLGAQLLGSIFYGAPVVVLWFILLGPVLLITIFVHELGHCFAARCVGGSVQGILLWPLGGLAFIGHDAGPKADMWVAFSGPLTHLPMTGFWVGMLAWATWIVDGTTDISLTMPWPWGGAYLWQAVCVGAVIMNISLFAFNLLVPAFPLDGGRILVDGLLAAGVSDDLTAKITIGVATPIGLGIIAFGIVYFQMVTILVGCFILFSTYQLFQHFRQGTLKQHPMFALGGEADASHQYYDFGSSSMGGHGKQQQAQQI